MPALLVIVVNLKSFLIENTVQFMNITFNFKPEVMKVKYTAINKFN